MIQIKQNNAALCIEASGQNRCLEPTACTRTGLYYTLMTARYSALCLYVRRAIHILSASVTVLGGCFTDAWCTIPIYTFILFHCAVFRVCVARILSVYITRIYTYAKSVT